LIEDARQLARIIEDSHPDPYINGGGKIAFHRRLQRILNTIPAEGMTKDEFIRLLRPFVVAVGDSHTSIWTWYQVDGTYPGGVPLRFGIVEESLYVAGVPDEETEHLIGAALVSVEGVPLAELVRRQEGLRTVENLYNALYALANESLWYKPFMQDLLPEWQDTSQVTVELQLPTGEIQAFSFTLPQEIVRLHTPTTQVTLPSTGDAGFLYDYVDTERQVAYLRVDHMTNYREDCERDNSPEQCISVPSVTETFRNLVIHMKAAGSEALIVDLRDNTGGVSRMADILIYFLFGKDALLNVKAASYAKGGSEVRRYSSLYLKSSSSTLEEINEGRAVPLMVGDYDLLFDFTDNVERFQELLPQAPAYLEDWAREMPTFYAEYASGTYAGYHPLDKVVVLVTPKTYSSGFTMLRYLHVAGATLVGTPSGQAANTCGNGLFWQLNHTGIEGMVSAACYVEFPNDLEMGRVLPVHYPLTYEKLASYGFDPNAEYLYALELLPELEEMAPIPAVTVPEGGAPSTTPAEGTPGSDTAPETQPGNFSRDQLIEDARQLAHALESAHPDPYINGGGKIPFYRRLQGLLNAIPAEGMTRSEFIRLLRPFVAAVGDAHTDIWDDYYVNDYAPGGVPLRFGIVEESLYVAGVFHEEDRDLLGARLVSVEGVPLAELCERQKRLQGTENEYNVLYLLADLSLWYRPFMEELLPEWQQYGRVMVELQLPGNTTQEVVFTLPQDVSPMFTPGSQVTLPAPDSSGLLYEFLDGAGKTAYLRITHLTHYREAREMETGRPAPDLRSATETFRSLVVEMEEAGTNVLIVDLRGNQGGHSVMGDILTYFLYGKEVLQDIMTHADAIGGGMVRKYSDLFWERTQSWTSLEQVNEGRALPLEADDYDFAGFSGDVEWSPERRAEAIAHSETVWLSRSPTFWEEYQFEAYSGHYCPKTVLVLTDSETFSSGFTMARYLYLAGATFIGTPSGQAANSFGNGQLWHLDHTDIEGTVSTTYSIMFPDDSELAHVLPVHHPLTYESLASYGFDPNAEYLYALELFSEPGEQSGEGLFYASIDNAAAVQR
jgi:hypothetical protein